MKLISFKVRGADIGGLVGYDDTSRNIEFGFAHVVQTAKIAANDEIISIFFYRIHPVCNVFSFLVYYMKHIEILRFCIVSVKTTIRSKPYIPFSIFLDGPDMVMGKGMRAVRSLIPLGLRTCFQFYNAICAVDPQSSTAVSVNGVYVVTFTGIGKGT